MRYLAIGSHPDDVELGCGGTLAKRADEGHSVYILHLSRGPAAREHGINNEKAAHRAGEIIGALAVTVLDLPDNKFDLQPMLSLAQAVEAYVNITKPDVIFAPWHGDLNQDHSMTAHAVAIATRPLPGRIYPSRVYAYEVLSSTEWTMLEPFKPNSFVDISSTIDRKLDAFSVYESEVNDSPHPRSMKTIKAQAIIRGSQCGVYTAEAFQLLRGIE